MDFEVIRVSGGGLAGNPGSGPEEYPYRPGEAPQGQDGANGQSATRPTPGSSAQNIQVRLHYDETHPAVVQVTGEGAWSSHVWPVTREQKILLDCKGGDGGRGGKGQDGQPGGQGYSGRDATKYRDGENGGPGGRGGDGGFGTNGADGGDAGNVLITVNEDDMDLLVACTWDTSGGKGGVSGAHGMPGDGGIGGSGGRSHTWTERSMDGKRVYHRSRPPGAPGHQGAPGSPPSTYLSSGKNGKEGSTQIRILNNDLTEATFPAPYDLQVVGFEVLDENEDGINEPGEHLIVTNIKVQNKGPMPSPGLACPISILIHGTQWLQPVESEPLTMPLSILPGDIVDVPGKVRAFIRNETAPRASGEPLRVQDEVSLIASFSKRLDRVLPNFCGSTKYLVSYPLELTPPRYLESVQKGDRVRFSWTLRNVSRKAQGIDGTLARYVATRFSDPGKVFELPYSTEENRHEAIDPLEELQPGEEVPIEQDFVVSPTADEYSDAELHLELLLADPHQKDNAGNAITRSIMKYNLELQVAGVYTFDPESRFLLVVNSKTPNWAIHQIIGFVRHELKLGLDIFNLNLTGSTVDSATQRRVLQDYKGKSIIVYGNPFPYFEKGLRNPWQLLDAWELCSLVKGGTNLLFCGVSDEAALKHWASNITYAAEPSTTGPDTSDSIKNLIAGLQDEDRTIASFDIIPRPFKSKASCGDSLGSCFMGSSADIHAQRGAKKLTKALPLQRFLLFPDENEEDPKMPTIIAVEGLQSTANIVSSTVPPTPNDHKILSDHHKYAILSILPFKDLARLFWNCWGIALADEAGVNWFPVPALYSGLAWNATQGEVWEGALLHSKILGYICLALENHLGSEITYFLSGKAPAKVERLSNLNYFLNVPQGSGTLTEVKANHLVVKTLGTILGALLNIGFGQWFSNVMFPVSTKRKLRNQVSRKIKEAVGHVCDSATATAIFKSVEEAAKNTKKEIKASGGNRDLSVVIFTRLAELTGMKSGLSNIAALNPGCKAVSVAELQQIRADHGGRTGARDEDEKQAIVVLARHVNPTLEDDEDLDEDGDEVHEM